MFTNGTEIKAGDALHTPREPTTSRVSRGCSPQAHGQAFPVPAALRDAEPAPGIGEVRGRLRGAPVTAQAPDAGPRARISPWARGPHARTQPRGASEPRDMPEGLVPCGAEEALAHRIKGARFLGHTF